MAFIQAFKDPTPKVALYIQDNWPETISENLTMARRVRSQTRPHKIKTFPGTLMPKDISKLNVVQAKS